MEGDKKRTPGQWLDEVLKDENLRTVKISITLTKPKPESPKPVKPHK